MRARSLMLGILMLCLPCFAEAICTPRHASTVRAFRRLHACPATGKHAGACAGWVIDHRIALACGGADDPANMQWQTAAEAKGKDRWERRGCPPCYTREKKQ